MAAEHAKVSNDTTVTDTNEPQPLPTTGWMYRERKIGKLTIPMYASPIFQLLLVSFVCFLCPGMFNALGGLGGGGKADHTCKHNPAIIPFLYLNISSLTSRFCSGR